MTYYIEIRYFGSAKKNIRQLISGIDKRFYLRSEHKVPHITLIQPFITKRPDLLVRDFEKLCSRYDLMSFSVDGIGVFPFFVVFAKVIPSDNLLLFRKQLLNMIKSYSSISDINRPYKPHTTLALRMGFFNFFRIWFYLRESKKIKFTNRVIRVTLLDGKKILYEYDFLLKRLLNRQEAKHGKILSKTFKELRILNNLHKS